MTSIQKFQLSDFCLRKNIQIIIKIKFVFFIFFKRIKKNIYNYFRI